MTCIRRFRAAASLKQVVAGIYVISATGIRRFRAAASLKQITNRGEDTFAVGIRRFRAAASLKHLVGLRLVHPLRRVSAAFGRRPH